MGWDELNPDDFQYIMNHKYVVVLFVHTTRWDFVLTALYRLAYPEHFKYVKLLMKPQPFSTPVVGSFLRYLGFIPATRAEEESKGCVASVIKTMKSMDNCYLLLSPEGKIPASKWRSGWYYIGDGMNCQVTSVGLDYNLKKFIFNNIYTIRDWDKTLLQNNIINDMSKIIPLYPSNTNHESKFRFNEPFNRRLIYSIIASSIPFHYVYSNVYNSSSLFLSILYSLTILLYLGQLLSLSISPYYINNYYHEYDVNNVRYRSIKKKYKTGTFTDAEALFNIGILCFKYILSQELVNISNM